MREDPRNWHRRIRKERAKEIVEWLRLKSGRYEVKLKTGEKLMEGASAFTALKSAYSRAGDNLLFFSREEGAQKFVSLPLYSMYLIFFTIVPLYPIFASKEELKKMTIPLLTTMGMSEDEFEEYLEPPCEQDKPDLESMLIKARQEEAQLVRNTITKINSERPKVEAAPMPTTRRPRVYE